MKYYLQKNKQGRVFLSETLEEKKGLLEEIDAPDWITARSYVSEEGLIQRPGYGWFVRSAV